SRRIVWMWLRSNHLIENIDASSANLLNILPDSVPKTRTRDLVQSTESSHRPLQDVVNTVEVRRGVVWGGLEVEQIKRRLQVNASIGESCAQFRMLLQCQGEVTSSLLTTCCSLTR